MSLSRLTFIVEIWYVSNFDYLQKLVQPWPYRPKRRRQPYSMWDLLRLTPIIHFITVHVHEEKFGKKRKLSTDWQRFVWSNTYPLRKSRQLQNTIVNRWKCGSSSYLKLTSNLKQLNYVALHHIHCDVIHVTSNTRPFSWNVQKLGVAWVVSQTTLYP